MRLRDRISKRLDERGVALPLALFGLIAASVMVTSALVTSSREVGLSRAHQEGTQDLYAADDALEQFVAARASATPTPQLLVGGQSYNVSLPTGEDYVIRVAELHQDALVETTDSMSQREVYSLVAAPEDGRGRSIGALLEVIRSALKINLDVDSGLTLGTSTAITGNAHISDGSDIASAACRTTAADSANAIRYSSESEVTIGGAASNNLVGDTVQDSRTSEQLMLDLLGDQTIESLSSLAHIKFGAMFGESAYPSGAGPTHTATNPDLRWGCPAVLVSGCPAAARAEYPTVVIDAQGGEVGISNYHGQGILIVRNGNLNISGSFRYAGIILVEGSLRITGGGGGDRKLQGAVVAMGDEVIIDEGDESLIAGNNVITFDKCEIAAAQRALTLQALDQRIDQPTFAWFEVIR